MEQHCALCGRFVELTPEREVHTLRQISGDMKEFVCDLCINEKLNGGKPARNCLFYKKKSIFYKGMELREVVMDLLFFRNEEERL